LTKEDEYHRKTGAKCFNEAWKYLDKKKRTAEEDKLMLQLVHSSRYHWGLVGKPRNFAIADWQVSRAYAALGEGRLALAYAFSSLKCCEEEGLGDIVPSVLEGMARAYAVSGDAAKARSYLSKAKTALKSAGIEPEDMRIYRSQIGDTERLIRG